MKRTDRTKMLSQPSAEIVGEAKIREALEADTKARAELRAADRTVADLRRGVEEAKQLDIEAAAQAHMDGGKDPGDKHAEKRRAELESAERQFAVLQQAKALAEDRVREAVRSASDWERALFDRFAERQQAALDAADEMQRAATDLAHIQAMLESAHRSSNARSLPPST